MSKTSIEKRTSARLAAVQYLYQWKLREIKWPVEDYINHYSERLLEPNDREEEDDIPLMPSVAPDFAFLRKLLNGLVDEQATVQAFLSQQMDAGRSFDRTSPLIQALLEAGTYELIHHETLDAGIILSEYTALAAGFFDNPELGFVNGVLQEAAKSLRSAA